MNNDLDFLYFIIDETELEITHRKMFSSLGLYLNDKFFGIINENILYLKTNETTRKKFEEYKMKPFTPSKEQVLKNYMEVPEEVIEDREKLMDWILRSASL